MISRLNMGTTVKKMLKVMLNAFMILILTAISQIGGIVWLIAAVVGHFLRLTKWKITLVFLGLYSTFTFGVVPLVAPVFGRTPLPLVGILRPLNFMTYLLNRQYVKPSLKDQLIEASQEFSNEFSGNAIHYLDANFPFWDGFPLLPHLSHSDGRKVDIAFCYNDAKTGLNTNSAPSIIGYGIYEAPIAGEVNYPRECMNRGNWHYGLISFFVPKWNEDKFIVDSKRTKRLIQLLAMSPNTSKIFIEPHLVYRWDLESVRKIRFHGCHAVRHDDHIHLQAR